MAENKNFLIVQVNCVGCQDKEGCGVNLRMKISVLGLTIQRRKNSDYQSNCYIYPMEMVRKNQYYENVI